MLQNGLRKDLNMQEQRNAREQMRTSLSGTRRARRRKKKKRGCTRNAQTRRPSAPIDFAVLLLLFFLFSSGLFPADSRRVGRWLAMEELAIHQHALT